MLMVMTTKIGDGGGNDGHGNEDCDDDGGSGDDSDDDGDDRANVDADGGDDGCDTVFQMTQLRPRTRSWH